MMRSIRDKETLKQLFLYGVIGVVINLLGFGLYVLITWFGIEPKLAMTFLYSAGVLTSFFANKNLVFDSKHSGYVVFFRFIMAHIGGYAINFLLLYYFYDLMGVAHEVVQLSAIFIVAIYLFIIFKFWVFGNPSLTATARSSN
ncbi:MAG: GtrA family protein [Hydrogenovibrio sp.]|uniref:GtrA family protein n=1 Tax=Hydrogenovibrio sp. TaxID=2065821 RepID=UPI0028701164|nr:GtrA family protein [Hydrogenovibrio sp.]MDR9498514.1 GtrA family protein [Hydrogenovibrio sp.]MDR9499256.1 GtrA family protein [Hydrogenovibrio sp.]